MDLGIIIITLVFIAIVTAPFILTGNSRKRKKKILFHQLTKIAENDDCTITQHEFCAEFVIGLDEMANHLFFYKKVETREIAKSLHLSEFKSCSLINSNRTVSIRKEKYYVVDKLELTFYPAEKEAPEISIELYNDEFDSLTLTGELQLAEKWEKLLNEKLKSSPKQKTEADPQTGATVYVPTKQKPRKPVAA